MHAALRAVLFLALVLGLTLTGIPARAILLSGGQSTEGLGAYEAELTYFASGPNAAELTVVLYNLTDPALGGFITAFALNNPGNAIATVEAGPDFPGNFQVLDGDDPIDGVKASPFGFFDFGASISGDFIGGGSPLPGIPATGDFTPVVFTFLLTGANLDQLSELDFAMTGSKPKGKSGTGVLAVRFKGFADGGSDKTLAVIDYQPPAE